MQRMLALADGGHVAALSLPPADAEVLPGVRWGCSTTSSPPPTGTAKPGNTSASARNAPAPLGRDLAG